MSPVSRFSAPSRPGGLSALDLLMILLGILACLFLLPDPHTFYWH